MTYKVKTDCMVEATYSYRLKELGVSVGPVTKIFVSLPGGSWGMELQGATLGSGPGTEVDNCTMKRVSMQ